MMDLPKITDVSDLNGKTVLLRTDFNVPVNEKGEIQDDFRIRKALPTISYLRDNGAKTIIISHIGRGGDSLDVVYDYLAEHMDIEFVRDYMTEDIKGTVEFMGEGDVFLFENLRLNPEEKENDEEFAEHLASLADIFVNDAFSVSHREHASIVGIPRLLPSYAGLQLVEEVGHLSLAFNAPHPFLFVIGGAKFETKIPLVQKFLPLVDSIYIGGALANYFLSEEGFNVGTSLVPDVHYDVQEAIDSGKIILPKDVVINDPSGRDVKHPQDVDSNDDMLDVGPESIEELERLVEEAEFVLWNGPLGYYEGGYIEATEALGEMVAESEADSVVGGGDTLAVISKLQNEEKFTFISTGGGAMLDFLADETLVGLDALLGSES